MLNYFKRTFFALICLPSLFVDSQELNLRVPYQIYENSQLLTFFGLYNSDDELIENVDLDDIAVEFGSRIARPNSLTKFSSEVYGTSYVFLIDTSKSISTKNFNLIKEAITEWIDKLGFADMAAIVSFGDSVELIQNFTFDKQSLKESLKNIQRDSMNTRYFDALLMANSMLTKQNADIPFRRAVITLTDGLDDPDPSSEVNLKYEEIKSMIIDSMVPYYMIGFAERSTPLKIQAIKDMKLLSTDTNGIFINANIYGIDGAFRQTQRNIDNVFLLKSSCRSCDIDYKNFSSTIYLDFESNRYSSTQKVFVNEEQIPTSFPISDNSNQYNYSFFYNPYFIVSIGIVLTILVAWLLFSRRKVSSNNIEVELNDVNYEQTRNDLNVPTLNNPDKHEFTIKLVQFSKKSSLSLECNFTDKVTIGRSSRSDLVLSDFKDISNLHAKIYIKETVFLIDDLDSTNHTYLNGALVSKRCPIENGDLVKFGINEFRVFIKRYEDLNYE